MCPDLGMENTVSSLRFIVSVGWYMGTHVTDSTVEVYQLYIVFQELLEL